MQMSTENAADGNRGVNTNKKPFVANTKTLVEWWIPFLSLHVIASCDMW
jgi:hypothetical protein